jgi:cytochrome oxidase Cu insertion factor (SCO1/SenC/PrrC family)
VFVRNRFTAILLTIALAATAAFAADEPKKAPEPLKIKIGDMAPDFTLLQYDGSKVTPVSLHDFKGKKQVALAFFVFAFTGG